MLTGDPVFTCSLPEGRFVPLSSSQLRYYRQDLLATPTGNRLRGRPWRR